MKFRVLLECCILLFLTWACSEGTQEMDSMTSFRDVTSLDVGNEEQELERLLDVTGHELQTKATRLQCFSCASTESWEDCEQKQVVVGCPKASTRCIKGSVTLKNPHGPIVTEFFKSCVSEEKCNTQHFPACLAGSKESARCLLECCDKRLCNKEAYNPNRVSKDSQRKTNERRKEKELKRTFAFNCKPPCLIYATNTEINGIDLKTSQKVQGMTSLSSVIAIDVDMATQTLYWSDKKERVIKRASLLSGVTEEVIGGEKSIYDGIAVDWLGRLLYWTDLTHKRIEVARLDGSSRKTIIDKNLEKPRAIVLDPQQGILFWTDWGSKPRLERSSLAGQDRQVLVSTDIRWPNGLVIDYANRRLYFCEANLDRIESINYDGSGRQVLYRVLDIHPFDIALYKTTLFWSDWSSRSIERVDTTNGKRLEGFDELSMDKVSGLVVLDKTRQPLVVSSCSVDNGGCSHLCFTTGTKTRVCGCPNGVSLLANQRTCDLGITTRAPTTRQPTTRQPTTRAPTTRAPTTRAPTTRAPTTRAPTTIEPTTIEPTTIEPTTREPTTREPTTRAPTTIESTTREPTTREPTTRQPTTKAPTTRRPTTTKLPTIPTTLQPTTKRPPIHTTTKLKTTQQQQPSPPTTQHNTTQKPIKTTMGSTTTQLTTHYPTRPTRPNTRLRLVNGDTPNEGRVEIRHLGRWGTICDDYWDLRDAIVVCRMLGYPGAIAAFSNGYFGPGRGKIWLDDVHCLGHESDITQCTHPMWGVNNCKHSEDAAVKCRPVTSPRPVLLVRLVNGRNQREGRVEVFHAGRWGTICDDMWEKEDADVICRMLGYPGAIAATRRATFGPGTGKIWMDNVQCQGSELSIEECTRLDWGVNNCQHSEDAGVICQPSPHTTLKPISTTPPSPVEGFAIVCLPHSMRITISRKQLASMTSLNLNPGLLHLNDPSCGVSKVSSTHVTFSTPLDACGTKRKREGDTLTFTNKVFSRLLPGSVKRLFRRPTSLTFPFKCSYSRITPRDRIYTPAHVDGHIEQW